MIMAKLTDNQRVVLSKAAARADGLAVAPAGLNKASIAKIGSSLVARKLMRESRVKTGQPIWREGAGGRGVSLTITRARRDAIGVGDEVDAGKNAAGLKGRRKLAPPAAPVRKAAAPVVASSPPEAPNKATGRAGASPRESGPSRKAVHMTSDAEALRPNAKDGAGGAAREASDQGAQPPRPGSKQALVIGMLSAKTGATLDALAEATGWLPHTVRAALTGLRRRGFMVERSRADGEASVYRIAAAMTAA
jgi:hypothetical protein